MFRKLKTLSDIQNAPQVTTDRNEIGSLASETHRAFVNFCKWYIEQGTPPEEAIKIAKDPGDLPGLQKRVLEGDPDVPLGDS